MRVSGPLNTETWKAEISAPSFAYHEGRLMPLRPVAFSVPVLFAALATAQTPPPALKFDFGAATPAPGYTQVLDTTMYSDDLGYGFEPGAQLTAVHRGGGDPDRKS